MAKHTSKRSVNRIRSPRLRTIDPNHNRHAVLNDMLSRSHNRGHFCGTAAMAIATGL
ncbi:MAG: hypothetical protein JWL69_3043 [Phycisphaerales bacterium]|nr:hypothetical protein [Phycisphaerales bacterium]MDB5353577.1 hypothetical protein [Phycisphaerales bacterium]